MPGCRPRIRSALGPGDRRFGAESFLADPTRSHTHPTNHEPARRLLGSFAPKPPSKSPSWVRSLPLPHLSIGLTAILAVLGSFDLVRHAGATAILAEMGSFDGYVTPAVAVFGFVCRLPLPLARPRIGRPARDKACVAAIILSLMHVVPGRIARLINPSELPRSPSLIRRRQRENDSEKVRKIFRWLDGLASFAGIPRRGRFERAALRIPSGVRPDEPRPSRDRSRRTAASGLPAAAAVRGQQRR